MLVGPGAANSVIRHPYAGITITLSCYGKFNLSHCEVVRREGVRRYGTDGPMMMMAMMKSSQGVNLLSIIRS